MWTLIGLLALGVWVWLQGRRINQLTRRVAELEQHATSSQAEAPAANAKQEPLLLDTPLDADELLLDTPLPEASNDAEFVPPPPPPATITPLRTTADPPTFSEKPQRHLEQWLAENGLAWIAGIAFAIGAIFLVSVAAQQNWFTPPLQLSCAIALGVGLIGASEWMRRISARNGHPLIAALLAGAGVVAFYATCWAAHGIYAFIDLATAAILLSACALLLIALAMLHGEPLGVLAVAAALLAPPLTHAALWPDAALTLYVCAVGATAFALACLRRWAWVAAAAIAGLYFWFAAAIAADDVLRALAFLSFAAFGGTAAALRPALPKQAEASWSWARARTTLPSVALGVSSGLVIWTWLSLAPTPTGSIAGPALVGLMFVGLTAAAVRARAAAPATFAIAAGALVVGFMAYVRARNLFGPLDASFYPFILLASVCVIASTLGARPHRRARLLLATTGAIGASLLALLAATSRSDWHSWSASLALFGAAAMKFIAAAITARSAQDAASDKATGAWTIAGAILVLVGIESAFAPELRVAAHAFAAVGFAAALKMYGWRALRLAALTGATLSIAHALSPNLAGAVLTGDIPLWRGLAIIAAAIGAQTGASLLAGQRDRNTGEGLSSAALILAIIGIFLALRWFAAGHGGASLDALTETSLRIVALLSAGLLALPREGAALGFIGKWRGHVLMSAGLAYTLFAPELFVNPWWGTSPAPIIGPPILDTLALAFAAPAALAFSAARQLYTRQRMAARIYAASGGVLALSWGALVLRRAFHAASMTIAPVAPFEAACYGLLLLGFGLAVAIVARVREAKGGERPFTHDLAAITRACAWACIVTSAWIMLAVRHPWWGAQAPATTNALSTGLATLAQACAVGLSLALGRALSRSRAVDRTRFAAAAAAILFAWSFGHAAIRWAFQAGAMDDGVTTSSVEGYLHALWPLAFVLGGAALTARAPGRDSVRAYLHDLQAIWATAVWPALGFAGLGLWSFFNPWWGATRAFTTMDANLALPAYIAAAVLSATALRVPHLRRPDWFSRTATIAIVVHLVVGLTVLVRRVFHTDNFSTALATDIELWTYSAAWALYGGAVFWFGMRRGDATLRWSGLGVLFATAAYVFYLAFTRLTGFVQAGSMLGLATVLLVVAWAARTNRSTS